MAKLIKKYQKGYVIPPSWSPQDSAYVAKIDEARKQERLESKLLIEWNKAVAKKSFPFQIAPGMLAMLANAVRQIYRQETGKTKSGKLYKEAEKMRPQTQWKELNMKTK